MKKEDLSQFEFEDDLLDEIFGGSDNIVNTKNIPPMTIKCSRYIQGANNYNANSLENTCGSCVNFQYSFGNGKCKLNTNNY